MASQQPYQLTARTLALSDVIPTQAADGATEVGKNTIQDVADLITAGSIVTVKIPVSSAEILQLFTTPKVLVSAPGAGKFIKVFSITYALDFNTTPYGINISLAITQGADTLISMSSVLGVGVDYFTNRYLAQLNFGASPENQDVILTILGTGNPISGDSDIVLYLTYCIISL